MCQKAKHAKNFSGSFGRFGRFGRFGSFGGFDGSFLKEGTFRSTKIIETNRVDEQDGRKARPENLVARIGDLSTDGRAHNSRP